MLHIMILCNKDKIPTTSERGQRVVHHVNEQATTAPRPMNPSSDSSLTAWEAEVQRAIPQLLVQFQDVSKKDWRHQLKILEEEMKKISTEMEFSTQWIHTFSNETDSSLSLVTTVENALEDKYPGEIQRLRNSHEELEKLKRNEKELSNRIATVSTKLNQVSIELEQVKKAVEEKGRSITDTSLLVQRKSALERLKADVRDYDVQIGILDHFCLQQRVYEAKRKLESSLRGDL